MRRFTILASSLPLILAALVTGRDLFPASQPCIAVGDTTVQLATAPWQVQSHVSFTDDPARATVRVQIVDSPEAADLAIADDVDTAPEAGCAAHAASRLIGIAKGVPGAVPVIYLTRDGEADYRIYVNSASVTAREAAALIVGAHGGATHTTQAAL